MEFEEQFPNMRGFAELNKKGHIMIPIELVQKYCIDKQKLLDVSAVSGLGWNARIGLKEGITSTYHWYLNNC